MSIRRIIGRNIINLSGWRTNRKIVVFESDDWGSIRMPSREVHEDLLKSGIRVDKCPYSCFDSLEGRDDLTALFDVLLEFRDKNENHPVITANTVVANPDFERIKASDYREYYYESFAETYKRYSKQSNTFPLWKQGMEERVFYPQFHGREHVNVALWLKLLQDKNKTFNRAFKSGLWGLGPEVITTGKVNIQASFDAVDSKECFFHKAAIIEGLDLFENSFGFRSKSFIASNFVWDTSLNIVLAENGVNLIQGMKYQKLPYFVSAERTLLRHSTGKTNNLGQIYLVRNCEFEPTQRHNIDSVDSAMKDIANAFVWKTPAIISAHRLNFIGSIHSTNRDNNLVSLHKLLAGILKEWPDTEFMNSEQLGEIVRNR